MDTDYYSVSEAADYLNVGKQAVYRAIERGTLTAKKLHGITVIEKQQVHAYKVQHAYKKAGDGSPRKEETSPHPDHLQGADDVNRGEDSE